MFSRFSVSQRILVVLLVLAVVAMSGASVPQVLYAAPQLPAHPTFLVPNAQPVPDPLNQYVPVIVQIALIVLIAQGIKSLGKALIGKDEKGEYKFNLEGRAAAIAYIVVGLIVYGYGLFVQNLPPETAVQVNNFVGVAATLLAGSGLFSMTAVFRQ